MGPFSLRLQERSESLWLARPSWPVSVVVGAGAPVLAKLLRAPFEPFLQGAAALIPYLPMTLFAGYATGGRAGSISLVLGVAMVFLDLRSRPQLCTPGQAAADLAAYGRAQELVSQDRLESVSLADLVDTALQPFIPAEDPHILIEDGEFVLLPGAAATALTLALHELATNAAKYGALKTDDVVRLFWRRDTPSTVRLSWIESGGPPVQEPAAKGFGSTLVQSAFSGIAEASVLVSYLRDGVRCEFHLRCDASAPPPSGPASAAQPTPFDEDTA